MRNFTRWIFSLFLGLLSFTSVSAQCPFAGTLYGAAAAPTTCTPAFATPNCHYTSASGGDHASFTGLVAGSTYTIRTSASAGSTVPNTDELTVYLSTNTTTGNHVAYGTGGSVTFTPATSGTYVLIINKAAAACGTLESVCRYPSIQCTSCAGPGAPACPTLTAPANNATGVSTLPTLTWSAATNAVSYDVYIDADATCSITPTTLVATVSTTSYTLTSSLSPSTNYRWMIVPKDCGGAAPASCTPFCFTTTVAPPANDNCTGTNGTPVALTPQSFATSCSSPVAATTVGATQSNTNCSTTATNDDVWFSFTANATTQTVRFEGVTAVSGTVTSMGMDTYTTCGGTNSNCNTGVTLTSGAGQANLTGLTIGASYFLRVWTTGTSNSATFNICIIDPPPPPANDDCANATAFPTIPTDGTCVTLTNQSTAFATNSNVTPTGACSSNPVTTDDDVWFSFVAPAPTLLLQSTLVSGSTDVYWQVFSSACGSSMTSILCTDTDAGGTITGLTTGSTYYIRLFTWTNGASTTQNICLRTPPPMAYVSSTTTQVTGSSGAGSIDQQTIRIDVTVINQGSPLSITSFNLNTNGTSVPADISNAKIYYTGTSTTFSTSNLFGSLATPSGAFTINGSQELTGGTSNTTNYFWLAYDLVCGATGPNLDGECNSFVIGGGSQTPTVQAPVNNRTITALTSFATASNGNWSSPSTWLCGVPPSGTTIPIVINNNVTLDVNVDFDANLTINAGRTLSVSSNTLTVGPVGGGNRSVTVNGTLNLSGGTINVNGNMTVNSGAIFNQTGGDLILDGNNGTSGGSVASGTYILSFANNNNTLSGGSIVIVDPHYASTTTLYFNGGAHANASASHTFQFGDGTSTTAGGSNGFYMNTWVGPYRLSFGNYVVDALTGTNRFVSSLYSFGISGDLTINSGEFRPGVVHYIAGNLTNNGTYTSTSTLTLATFLSGSAAATTNAQTIGGSGVFRNLTSSPTANATSLTVNNTSTSGVAINLASFQVSSTLTLTAGKVTMNGGTGAMILGISTSTLGTLTGGSASSYIIGELRRWNGATTLTASRIFPIGSSTNYQPISISFSSAQSTGGVISALFTASDPGTSGLPLTDGGLLCEAVSPSGYWTVERLSGAGGTYTADANANGFTQVGGGAITLFSQTRLLKRATSGSWTTSDGTPVAPTALTSVTRTGCTSFSQFALGGAFTALPLELTYFNGKALAGSNMLSWETALEKDVQWHIVERAADGVNFTEVGRTAGQLASSAPKKYELEDLRPIGKAYYRLRSVDLDGKESLSSVIVLERKGARFQIDNVFPSPTQGDLTVQFNAVEESAVNVMVHDFSGRLVLQQQLDAVKGFNQTSLQLGSLPAGMYNVTIVGTQSATEPVRIVKE